MLNEINRDKMNSAGWAIHSSNSCNFCLDLEIFVPSPHQTATELMVTFHVSILVGKYHNRSEQGSWLEMADGEHIRLQHPKKPDRLLGIRILLWTWPSLSSTQAARVHVKEASCLGRGSVVMKVMKGSGVKVSFILTAAAFSFQLHSLLALHLGYLGPDVVEELL